MAQAQNTADAAAQRCTSFFGQCIENIEASGRDPRKSVAGFVLAWAFFFAILFLMPVPEGLTPAGKATLAVVAWACVTWITEAVPVGVTGVVIPMLLVLSKAAPKFQQAVSGYTTTAAFICLVAFIMAAVIQSAGIDRRLAVTMLHKMRIRTANGAVWGLFGVNFLLSIIVPGANPRGALLLPIINGIANLFGDTPEERAAKKHIVIQALVYGSMIGGMCIMTSHLPNLVLVGLFQQQLNLNIGYFNWFLLQWPYLGMFLVTNYWVRWHFKTKGVQIPGGAAMLAEQYRKLPAISRSELMILGIFGFTALMWMTEEWHKIKSHDAAIIGLLLLFVPGVMKHTWREVQERTIWGTYLMLCGALSMSAAMGSSGLAQYLSDKVHLFAEGHSWWVILLIMMLATHVIRIGMLSNVAAISLFAPILLTLAPKLGLHPVAFTMLVSDTDSFAYILPTQVTVAVIAYSSGTFSTTDYAKVGWVSVLIAVAYGILVMAPWYAFMGLPVWDPAAPWPF